MLIVNPAEASEDTSSSHTATADPPPLPPPPPPHEPLHTNPALRDATVLALRAPVPLAIQASALCERGSGLFAREPVAEGRELYRVPLGLAAFEHRFGSICHGCYVDAEDLLCAPLRRGTAEGEGEVMRVCGGCGVARFCSKECEGAAWTLFHRDECEVLKETPTMEARCVLLYRLVFWHRRKVLPPRLLEGLEHLESHFDEFARDEVRSAAALGLAEAVAASAGVDRSLPWKYIPKVTTNCVPLRPASSGEVVGHALDVASAMVNHSCDPNAFLFFEGTQLRARTLKPIAAGEEITFCYANPSLDVLSRKDFLQRIYSFECKCPRCASELAELRTTFGPRGPDAVHDVYFLTHALLRRALKIAQTPGTRTRQQNMIHMSTLEQKLTSLLNHVASSLPDHQHQHQNKHKYKHSWPGHIPPLPSSHLTLALLHLMHGQPARALWYALRGLLDRGGGGGGGEAQGGPRWVNDMVDVVSVLVVVGNWKIPVKAAGAEDATLPSPATNIGLVAQRYLYEAWHEAVHVFGPDVRYTAGLGDMVVALARGKGGPVVGSEEFATDSDAAQRKLLEWADLPEELVVRRRRKGCKLLPGWSECVEREHEVL